MRIQTAGRKPGGFVLGDEANSAIAYALTYIDKLPTVAHKLHMAEILRTAEFDKWLKALRDTKARAKVLIRIDRLALGNPGDVEPVGDGVREMRIHYGPGYRVYFKQHGDKTILLFGGDKDSQAADINRAKAIAETLEN